MTLVHDSRTWTREERDALPDDGLRYELIDGALVVTPAPLVTHQRAVVRLTLVLAPACPDDLEVFTAPFDVALDAATVLQPDLVVVRRADLAERGIDTTPVLAVEILSPSTQVIDRNLKFERHQRAGTPSYWLVDPETPSVTAYELRDGRYVLAADITGDDRWTATQPYAVSIRPSDLT